MRFALLVALSHLRSRRHEAGVSVIALISVLGVTVGVMALLMVIAVMEGFEVDLRDKILGSNAHVVALSFTGYFGNYAEKADQVAELEGIEAAAPFMFTEAMIRSSWGSAGVILKGIDPERTPGVTDVVSNLTIGPLGEVDHPDEQREILATLHEPPRAIAQSADDTDLLPGLIVGKELADQLKVYPGDRVHVINPIGGGTGPMGLPVPRVLPVRVAGVFHSGMYEYDTKWTYMTLADTQAFLQVDDVASGIEVRVIDPDEVDESAPRIEKALGAAFYARHWQTLNRSLFAALKLEKIVMGLLLSIITLVAGLNILGLLILVVVTRAREISILRAMGASKSAVRMVFMLEGLIIGVVGTFFGTILGLLGCMALDRYQFPLDTDVYYLDSLPVVIVPETVVVVALSAIAISFVATLYPATVAAGIDPVEGLRYE